MHLAASIGNTPIRAGSVAGPLSQHLRPHPLRCAGPAPSPRVPCARRVYLQGPPLRGCRHRHVL